MNVRKKAILTVALIFSIALVVVIATSQTIILVGFAKLEKEDTNTQTTRAADALNREILDLDTLTFNNAAWNDTYQFIQDNNTAYINAYLNDPTFSAANLNLEILINCSGQIICSKIFDIQAINPRSLFGDFKNLLSSQQNLWNFSSPKSFNRGIINLEGSLFLICSRPILTNDYTGPVKGALVMGRILSADIVASIENQTHLQIIITNLMNSNISLDFQEIRANVLGSDLVYVKPVNSSLVVGYASLKDVEGNPCAILGVYLPRAIYKQGTDTVSMFTYLLAFLFTAFGGTTVLFLEKSLLSRISKLTNNVQEITRAENVKQRVNLDNEGLWISKDDELTVLSQSVNNMLDKIQEITDRLNKSERFAAVGELSVMVAHDLRNPLQGIKIAADFLSREKTSSPEKKARMLEIVKADIQYCEKIVNDLLDYSREPRIMPSETNLPNLLSATLSHMQVPENIRISNLTSSDSKIHVDTNMMTRVFDNMVKNAIEAMPKGGDLTIDGEASANKMRISFADTGTGIAKDDLKKLFVPHFTTKAKGMGLGLAICKRIVEAHKGTISVESETGKGTKFTIEIPR